MLRAAPAFLAGVVLLFACTPEAPLAVYGGVALVSATACLAFPRARWLAMLPAGFFWASWQAQSLLEQSLPTELEGQDLLVSGVVIGLPEYLDERRLRLRFRIESYRQDGKWRVLHLPVRLTAYHHLPDVGPGERWQWRVRLKAAHGFANPGGFDYERWLFAQGLRATGYIRKGGDNRRLDSGEPAPLQSVRLGLSQSIQALNLNADTRALLRALAIGERSGLSSEQWDTLAQTGTSHLLAISGLHVGLVAALGFALVRRLWRWAGLGLRLPADRAAALAAIVFALLYALLAGFDVPARRALIMICVWMGARVLDLRPRPWQVLATALWLVLLFDPLAVLSTGFWLSFAAVAWILVLTSARHGRRTRIAQALVLQAGLVVGLTPLLWLGFQSTALGAPLANLLAIPWVGVLVVPALLLAVCLLPLSPLLAEWLFRFAALALEVLWHFLRILADLPNALWVAPPMGATGYALVSIGLLWLLAPRRLGVWPVGLALLIPPLFTVAPRPGEGEVWMSVLDVGQGLAVVVETCRHLLVYDAGPAYPGGLDTGETVVLPFLRGRGHAEIDRLIVSHGDLDHRGGAPALLRALPVARFDSGEPQALTFARASACRAGERWRWDGVAFEYLAPLATASGNNASCVLRIATADGRTLLLTGDIERRVERALLASAGERLAADVLVAPHHGSLTSSGRDFIGRIRPALAVFSTGYRNRFGFPREAVVARYRALGVEVADTARTGALEVRLEGGQALAVTSRRATYRRLWHHRLP